VSIDRAKAMQAAQKYLAKGQLDKAIVEYERLVQSDPKDARTLLKLGDLYTRKGDTKEASAAYRKVADQYADQGFFLKAVAVCKQILKLDPSQLEVWEKLAEMYELLSLVSDALATYEQVVEAHTRAGNARKALRALEKTADLDPENVASRIRYAEALSRLNKTEEAAAAFAQGAELLKKQGRIDDFVKVGERLLYHQPDNYPLCRELAATYLQRGDTKLALAKLQVCFNAEPKSIDTLKLLAKTFEQMGQLQKTVSVLKEVARVHATQARPGEQGSVLRKILALDPDDVEARRELSSMGDAHGTEDSGVVDISDGDYDEILVDDEEEEPTVRRSGASLNARAAEEEHKRSQVARLLSECDVFLRYGLYDKMITQLHQVLDLDPRSVEARSKLKEVYLKTNKTSDAVMQLIMIAELLAETNAEAARAQLGEALKLDPKNQAVADRLHNLSQVPAASDEDEVIILDHDEPHDETADSSDVTLTDSVPSTARPEESFASVIPSPDDAEAMSEQHDEPELTMDADSGEEIVMDAESVAPPPLAATPEAEPAQQEELPEDVAEALGEVEFYLKQGLDEEARETLQDALESNPDHPALVAKLAVLDGGTAQAAADPSFALAQKLATEAAPEPSSGTGPVEVADVIAQFKKGVAKQVDKGDAATHHDLGIAYMEMGLHAEAIDEFKLCLTDPARVCAAHTMIGLSYVAKGEMEPGVEHFKQALESQPSEAEELGLWFEIGNANELLGKNLEALVWYEKVEEKNPSFRDVAERIERLGVARTPQQEADDFDEMFDNMIVKD
jgi:tetratricopeptide (TPR) repeat protein